jgi:hypothetical protein
MNFCYASLKLLLKTYKVLFPQDCRIFGADRIPKGAKIIAANHPNVTDTFHLAWVIKDQLHTLIMGDLFSVPPSCTRTLRAQSNGRPRQGRWQTAGLCTLYFGDPWLPSNEIQGAIDDSLIYALTDQLMGKIYALSQKAFQVWLQDRSIHPVLYGWRDAFIDGQ